MANDRARSRERSPKRRRERKRSSSSSNSPRRDRRRAHWHSERRREPAAYSSYERRRPRRERNVSPSTERVATAEERVQNSSTVERTEVEIIGERDLNERKTSEEEEAQRLAFTVSTKRIRSLLGGIVYKQTLWKIAKTCRDKDPQFEESGYLAEFIANAFPRAVDVLRNEILQRRALAEMATKLKCKNASIKHSRRTLINQILLNLPN